MWTNEGGISLRGVDDGFCRVGAACCRSTRCGPSPTVPESSVGDELDRLGWAGTAGVRQATAGLPGVAHRAGTRSWRRAAQSIGVVTGVQGIRWFTGHPPTASRPTPAQHRWTAATTRPDPGLGAERSVRDGRSPRPAGPYHSRAMFVFAAGIAQHGPGLTDHVHPSTCAILTRARSMSMEATLAQTW